jgi:anti-sigma regulatory factor (Ser/Thr protein kinase)
MIRARVGYPWPVTTTLRADPLALSTAIRDARCLPRLRAWLREHVGDPDRCGDAELVCTELVTNAVEHARGPRSVELAVSDGRVRVRVTDGSPERDPAPGRSRFDGEFRGRGLTLVAALSEWTVRRARRSKTVEATLS